MLSNGKGWKLAQKKQGYGDKIVDAGGEGLGRCFYMRWEDVQEGRGKLRGWRK